MAIKIVEEEIKNPEEREPPGNVIFTYIPEKSSDESLQNFVLQQLQNSGIGRIDGHITSNEEKVDASHDENLNLYIDRHAADEIIEHCAIMAKKGLEALGFLVGDLYIWKGERYSVVHEIVTGELESTAVSVKFRRDEFVYSRIKFPLVFQFHNFKPPSYCFSSPYQRKLDKEFLNGHFQGCYGAV